jgi:hypothetical protein
MFPVYYFYMEIQPARGMWAEGTYSLWRLGRIKDRESITEIPLENSKNNPPPVLSFRLEQVLLGSLSARQSTYWSFRPRAVVTLVTIKHQSLGSIYSKNLYARRGLLYRALLWDRVLQWCVYYGQRPRGKEATIGLAIYRLSHIDQLR